MSQENVVLAREVVSAFYCWDVPALVELTTDDFEWVTWTGTVEPTVYHGADGLAGYFRDLRRLGDPHLGRRGVPRPR